MASPRSILEKDLAQREQNFLSLCRSLIEIITTQEGVGGMFFTRYKRFAANEAA